MVLPTHAPAEHASLLVHRLPSLHEPACGVWTQPLAGSQLSTVQGLLSSHEPATPGWQVPVRIAQVSVTVHASPSSQSVAGAWLQAPSVHQSFVQLLPSAQFVLAAQPPLAAQVS